MTDETDPTQSEGRSFDFDELVRPPVGAVTPIRDVPDTYVFRFEMGPAILAQLLEKLRGVPAAPIEDCLDAKYPGFYHIYYRGEPSYIGKSSRPLGDRLAEHVKKLSGRWDAASGAPLDLADVSVRYVYVEDPSLVDVSESALISFFAQNDLAPWSGTGYGSKVAGSGRKGQKAANWESLFPPDFDALIKAGGSESTLRSLIYDVARSAPVTLSIPRDHARGFTTDHPDRILHPEVTATFSEWIQRLRDLLHEQWQIEETETGFYVIPK